jgi:hypothetical protein
MEGRMSMRLMMVLASVMVIMMVTLAPGRAAADGSWLDTKPTWNSPGMAVPISPHQPPAGDARCFDALVVPDTAAKKAVVAAGWLLFTSPQSTAPDGVEIVFAQSAADGMCRPNGYQGFVFVDGTFAGTLAPAPMDSRTDGALFETSAGPDGGIEALYSRYRDSDPLCCPYARSTAVFDVAKVDGAPVLRLLSAGTVPNAAPTPAPTAMPRPSASAVPAPVQAPVQVPRGQ